MTPPRPRSPARPGLLLGSLLLLLTWLQSGHGLIVFQNATSTNNTFNAAVPGNGSAAEGAPWSHTAQQRRNTVIDSTAVYLGNGFLLTAAHTLDPTAVIIDGVSYSRDTSFPQVNFSPVDLRLYRIASPPALPLLPLISPADDDTGTSSVLIGWGKGKGAVINDPGVFGNKGWQWGGTIGDDVTKDKRWGVNTTNGSTETISYSVGAGNYSYTALSVFFNATATADEASGSLADSGGGLYQKFGGTWKLAGVLGAAFTSGNYATGASLTGPTPSKTVAVRIRDLAQLLRFKQWKEARSIPVASSDELDPDGDGVGILAEYAQALEPTVYDANLLPVTTLNGTNLTCTYRLRASATDLVVALEESASLGNWTAANVTSTQLLSTNGTVRTFRATVPLNGAARKFLRLRFTRLE